jgi:hypothetical protein
MKTTKMLYSVSLQSLMNEVKKQEEREKKNVANKIINAISVKENP